MLLFDDIEAGTEFYFSEEDYLTTEELNKIASAGKTSNCGVKVKTECTARADIPVDPLVPSSDPSIDRSGSPRGKKRPRRSAVATAKSYFVPDSDDEDIADEKPSDHVKKRRSETNLQQWIKHLTILHKEEQRKVSLLWKELASSCLMYLVSIKRRRNASRRWRNPVPKCVSTRYAT